MQKQESEEWTVPKLHQLLGKYIIAMEMAGSNESFEVSASTSQSNSTSVNQRCHSQERSTTGGLLAGNGKSSTSAPREFQT